MSQFSMKTKTLIVLIVLCLIGLLSLTFSYFALNTIGNPVTDTFLSDAASLSVTYTDNNAVLDLTNGKPGDSAVKTFEVTNSGSVPAYYQLVFDDLFNDFNSIPAEYDLYYSASCIEYSIEGGTEQRTLDPCESVSERIVPHINDGDPELDHDNLIINSSIKVDPNRLHRYNITVVFKNRNVDQSYAFTGNGGLGYKFSGRIIIEESVQPKCMLGIHLFSDIENLVPMSHTIVNFGEKLEGVTNDNGYIEFTSLDANKEYTMTIKDFEGNRITTKPVTFYKADSVSVSNSLGVLSVSFLDTFVKSDIVVNLSDTSNPTYSVFQ